jgi:hypothetical protein
MSRLKKFSLLLEERLLDNGKGLLTLGIGTYVPEFTLTVHFLMATDPSSIARLLSTGSVPV